MRILQIKKYQNHIIKIINKITMNSTGPNSFLLYFSSYEQHNLQIKYFHSIDFTNEFHIFGK